MAIASTAEYKTYAGISGSTDDTVLGVLITCANDLITRYCNRSGFDSATYTERYDCGPGQATFTVRAPPITSITSIKRLVGTNDSVTLDSDTYTFDAASGIVYLWGAAGYADEWGMPGFTPAPMGPRVGSMFSESKLQYQIIYAGGYGTIPDGLKLALYRVVDGLWASRRRDPALQSESIGAYSYSLSQGANTGGVAFSPEVRALLVPYVREGTV